MMNILSEIKFPKGGADIFLADREIIEIFNQHIHPKNTSTIAELLRIGFDPIYVPFKDQGNQQEKSMVLSKKIRLAFDTFLRRLHSLNLFMGLVFHHLYYNHYFNFILHNSKSKWYRSNPWMDTVGHNYHFF